MRLRENVYLPCWQVSKITITGNDAEAARGPLPRGKFNLHLLEVELEDVEDVEEVEEHLGPSTVSGAPESIARVEHDSITKTLDRAGESQPPR
jgi:hypothetical protein